MTVIDEDAIEIPMRGETVSKTKFSIEDLKSIPEEAEKLNLNYDISSVVESSEVFKKIKDSLEEFKFL